MARAAATDLELIGAVSRIGFAVWRFVKGEPIKALG